MTKQLEFDFWDRPLDGDKLYTKPAVEYFKRAFEYEPVRAEVEKREEALSVEYCRRCGVGSYRKEANVQWRADRCATYCDRCHQEWRAKQVTAKPTFKVGDKVRCKYGGVGEVAEIVTDDVSVFKSKTYVSRIHNSELTLVTDEPTKPEPTFAGRVQLLQELMEQGLLQPTPVPATTTKNEPILSTDSAERKATPIWSGWLQYFPLAHAAAARHSKRMNDKHNPGEPMHWAREKSKDHEDCAGRHLIDVNHFNEETQEYEEACSLFWRAGAILQLLEEKRLGKCQK